MAEVRTRDEALTAVARVLAEWSSTSVGLVVQASAAASAALREAEGIARRLASKVAVLQAALRSLPEDADPRPLLAELAAAERALDTARDAVRRLEHVAQRTEQLSRTHSRTTTTLVDSARADLGRRGADLHAYRAVGGHGGGGGSTAPSRGGGGTWLAAGGLSDLDVSTADYSDNPIVGTFGRGGTTRADYRWAVQTWDEVVRPGLDRGMTRDDFAARDESRNAPPLRRTAHVYDMFLGNDPIALSRGPDGRVSVTSGRHRIEVARELGITHLPGKTFG